MLAAPPSPPAAPPRLYPRCPFCLTQHDASTWPTLRLVGIWTFDDETLESRECCGSTVSVSIPHLAGFAVVVPLRAHRAAWLLTHREQLAAMARVVAKPAPAPVHPAVALFAAARARAMGPRERCRPGQVTP